MVWPAAPGVLPTTVWLILMTRVFNAYRRRDAVTVTMPFSDTFSRCVADHSNAVYLLLSCLPFHHCLRVCNHFSRRDPDGLRQRTNNGSSNSRDRQPMTRQYSSVYDVYSVIIYPSW